MPVLSGFKPLKVCGCAETVKNRFTGVEVKLAPDAVAVYDYIIGMELFFKPGPMGETLRRLFTEDQAIKNTCAARDWFRTYEMDAYMLLLD